MRDPLRVLQAAGAVLGRLGCFLEVQNAEEAAGGSLLGFAEIAAEVDRGIGGLLEVLHAHRVGTAGRNALDRRGVGVPRAEAPEAVRAPAAGELVRATPTTAGEVGATAEVLVGVHRHVGRGATAVEHFPVGIAGEAEQRRGPAVAASAHGAVIGIRAGEDAGERVVVAGRDRVELVVVAPGATDGQTEEPARGDVHLVVHHLELGILHAGLVESLGADGEEAGRDQQLVAFGLVLVGQLVAGDLLMDEPVVRFVGVERADDVVAILPRVGIVQVAVQAGGLAVAGHVEPGAAPLFPEVRRGDQLIHELLQRVGGLVLHE